MVKPQLALKLPCVDRQPFVVSTMCGHSRVLRYYSVDCQPGVECCSRAVLLCLLTAYRLLRGQLPPLRLTATSRDAEVNGTPMWRQASSRVHPF